MGLRPLPHNYYELKRLVYRYIRKKLRACERLGTLKLNLKQRFGFSHKQFEEYYFELISHGYLRYIVVRETEMTIHRVLVWWGVPYSMREIYVERQAYFRRGNIPDRREVVDQWVGNVADVQTLIQLREKLDTMGELPKSVLPLKNRLNKLIATFEG